MHCIGAQLPEGAGLEFSLHVSAHKIFYIQTCSLQETKRSKVLINEKTPDIIERLNQWCADLFSWIYHAKWSA